MTLKYVTLRRLLTWQPCDSWTEERILAATDGRRRLTPLEIIALPGVPAADKLWVLLREELLPASELRLFACWCADRALRAEVQAGRPPDKRSRAAVRVAREFARGNATADQLSAAESAAVSAAESAAVSAAVSAAWSAAVSAQLKQLKSVFRRLAQEPTP